MDCHKKDIKEMTSNGTEFLDVRYKVGNFIYDDYKRAIEQSVAEQNMTSNGSNIEFIQD